MKNVKYGNGYLQESDMQLTKNYNVVVKNFYENLKCVYSILGPSMKYESVRMHGMKPDAQNLFLDGPKYNSSKYGLYYLTSKESLAD